MASRNSNNNKSEGQAPVGRMKLSMNTKADSTAILVGDLLMFDGTWYSVALFKPTKEGSKLAFQGSAKPPGANREDDATYLVHLCRPDDTSKPYSLYGWVRAKSDERAEEYDISNRVYLYTDEVMVRPPNGGRPTKVQSYNVSGLVFPPDEDEPAKKSYTAKSKEPEAAAVDYDDIPF